jgi:hypothetical protein
MKMKSKKGSQVGMVISLLLFITFVIFMYMILNAKLDLGGNKKSSLEQTNFEIINNISEKMITASVYVNGTSPGNCIGFTGLKSKTSLGNNIKVQNASGNVFNIYLLGDNIYVDRGNSGSLFFTFYSSGEFPPASTSVPGDCTTSLNQDEGYILGLSKEETVVFESKVINLLASYLSNYSETKKVLNILPNNEFGFIFTYNNETEIKTPEKNLSINVYSERTPIQYIKADSQKEFGFLDTIIW